MSGRRKGVVYIVNADGCHICTSHAPGTHGYPSVWKDGRNQNLHRVLYEERHGKLPEGALVRHTCDNRLCINDAHHVPGTVKDNAVDRKTRGRNNTHRGETRRDAKLTQGQVDYIRTHPLSSQRELGELFGVGQSTISRIQRGLRWPTETITY